MEIQRKAHSLSFLYTHQRNRDIGGRPRGRFCCLCFLSRYYCCWGAKGEGHIRPCEIHELGACSPRATLFMSLALILSCGSTFDADMASLSDFSFFFLCICACANVFGYNFCMHKLNNASCQSSYTQKYHVTFCSYFIV